MMISLLDVALCVVVLYFALSAARHGFLKELFGKLSFIIGFLGAVFLCGILTPYFDNIVRSHLLSACLSFMLIFAVIFLFVKIVQMLLSGIFRGEIMRSLDKALGFIFGGIEGIVAVSLALILVKAQPWADTSRLGEICYFWEVLEPTLTPFVDFVSARLK